MYNQSYVFTIFILDGIIIGLLFDTFRILRKSFKTPDIVTYFEDFIFWILTFLIILYSNFKFNNGDLRLFIFIGLIIGISIYLLAFSKLFIKVNIYIINFIKKVIDLFIIIPIKYLFKFIRKIIFKPIIFISINISNMMSKFIKKAKKPIIKKKKAKKEKDFTNAC